MEVLLMLVFLENWAKDQWKILNIWGHRYNLLQKDCSIFCCVWMKMLLVAPELYWELVTFAPWRVNSFLMEVLNFCLTDSSLRVIMFIIWLFNFCHNCLLILTSTHGNITKNQLELYWTCSWIWGSFWLFCGHLNCCYILINYFLLTYKVGINYAPIINRINYLSENKVCLKMIK